MGLSKLMGNALVNWSRLHDVYVVQYPPVSARSGSLSASPERSSGRVAPGPVRHLELQQRPVLRGAGPPDGGLQPAARASGKPDLGRRGGGEDHLRVHVLEPHVP